MKEKFTCNKKVMIALDIRRHREKSLNKCIGALGISTVEAALALSMCMVNFEEQCEVFTYDEAFTNINSILSDRENCLDDIQAIVSKVIGRNFRRKEYSPC